MTVIEIKAEIIKAIGQIPDDSSDKILEELIKLKDLSLRTRNDAFVELIIKEDYELFKRLSE